MRHSTRAWIPFSLQLLRQRVLHAAQELLAIHAPRLNRGCNLLVAHRVGVAEGQVLKLAAHLAHAQPVRQRSVDVQRLARNRLLPLGFQVLQRTHVVQPVGQLDQHHANVTHHGQQHLAHVLGLAIFAVGKLDFVDLGYALDDVRHLVAKFLSNLLVGGRRIFDGIMQQRRSHGGRIQLHLDQHLGHFEWVNNIRLARGACLALVVGDAELPGLSNQ